MAGTSSLRIGNKQVELAATELDPKCHTLVTPFNPTVNVAELSQMAAGMAAEMAAANAGARMAASVQSAMGGPAAGKPPPAKPTAAARHNISLSVRRAAMRMNWLPMSAETLYGNRMLDQMKDRLVERDEAVGVKLYPQADALLKEVLAAVGVPHAYHFSVHIRADAGENAMALPGGFLVIDKALVADPSRRNKAYFAVAHEISHVLQRHETRAVQARIVDTVSLKGSLPDLVKTVRQVHSEPKSVLALVVVGKLLFEKHFEDQELQADACAVRLLDTTLNDSRRLRAVLVAFIADLPSAAPVPARGSAAAKSHPDAGALADVIELVARPINRHPSVEARLQNLRTMLADVEQRPLPAAKPGAKPVVPLPSSTPKPGAIKLP